MRRDVPPGASPAPFKLTRLGQCYLETVQTHDLILLQHHTRGRFVLNGRLWPHDLRLQHQSGTEDCACRCESPPTPNRDAPIPFVRVVFTDC